jgi:hypothetical protein
VAFGAFSDHQNQARSRHGFGAALALTQAPMLICEAGRSFQSATKRAAFGRGEKIFACFIFPLTRWGFLEPPFVRRIFL